MEKFHQVSTKNLSIMFILNQTNIQQTTKDSKKSKYSALKSSKPVFLLLLILFVSLNMLAQDSCKVLVINLQGHYKGGCKHGLANAYGIAKGTDTYKGEWRKGLPNGKGKYTWHNGNIYDGQWKKGKRNGFGIYHFSYNGNDSTMSGIWKNDIYQGKKIKQPTVEEIYNIDRYQIDNTNAFHNRVLFDFWQNGSRNLDVSDVNLISTNGTYTTSGQLVGYDNINFPVTITVRYTTYNKLHSLTYNAIFSITIYQAGDYTIKLIN